MDLGVEAQCTALCSSQALTESACAGLFYLHAIVVVLGVFSSHTEASNHVGCASVKL